MDWNEFAAYNPAFHRYITPPGRYSAVYVPRHAEQEAIALLMDEKRVSSGWTVYTVARGDTLSKISSRTGVPVQVLREVNPKSEPLQIGAVLHIPGRAGTIPASMMAPAPKPVVTPPKPTYPTGSTQAAVTPKPVTTPASSTQVTATPKPVTAPAGKPQIAPTPKPIGATHTVKPGDTLASLARHYNVSLTAMKEANAHLDNPNALKIGQTIKIPAQNIAPAAVPTVITYKVQPGDTMWGIARKFNMPPQELLALNNMNKNDTLRTGATIRVIKN
jgi:membrane-bound lytic murein transglycosylase D